MEKCRKSPCYFYNKYYRILDKDGNEVPKKELTEEEFTELSRQWEEVRKMKTRRGRVHFYPLTPDESQFKNPGKNERQ